MRCSILELALHRFFFDYNGDGLLDLLIGNFGYLDTSYYDAGLNLNCKYRGQLALLENCGTPTNPQFKLTNRNFADLPPSYFPVGERPYAIIPPPLPTWITMATWISCLEMQKEH